MTLFANLALQHIILADKSKLQNISVSILPYINSKTYGQNNENLAINLSVPKEGIG